MTASPQASWAKVLKVDQGKLSKIIAGKSRRPSGHAARLFAYAKQRLEGTTTASNDAVEGARALTQDANF